MENQLFDLKINVTKILLYDSDYSMMEDSADAFHLFQEDVSKLFGFSYSKHVAYRESDLDYSEKDWILTAELSLLEREFRSIHNILQIVEALTREYGWKLDYSVV